MSKSTYGIYINSNLIVTEVQKRPCLFDTNHPSYGDRAEKARCWEEVCESVVPAWTAFGSADKIPCGKEVQKRWRSIRDSYTKAYRQGKCVMPEQCPPDSRRYKYHKQMSFLLHALQNKKPRCSQDKYESFSEVSSSPQHPPPEDVLLTEIKQEIIEKPLDFNKKSDEKPGTLDKCNQATIDDMKNPAPDDHFDDDKSFMNSLLPLFKKMDDDTRLLCRIEVLKIIRYALQGHECFEALRRAEDTFFKNRITTLRAKVEPPSITKKNESQLSMTTRSADGSRPVRKRRLRSPSPLPVPPKRRGPGRPRKVRPSPSESDDEQSKKRAPKTPKLKVSPVTPRTEPTEMDESFNTATSVAQLSTPMFMKMYNLGRSKDAPVLTSSPQNMQISITTEPVDDPN